MREVVRQVDRLQRIAVFESTARLGSFTAAAKELGMTQPAVTRQIRSLEERLGAELFRRTANRSELTEIGGRLADRISAGFDVIEAGLAEFAEHAGTFVLAAHPGIAQQWIVPQIDGLHEALGDRDLRLWLFDRDPEVAGVALTLRSELAPASSPGQSSQLLFPERVVPVASPAFAEQWGLSESSTALDVYQAPFVHMDDGDHPWMTWSDWLAEFGITLRRQAGRVLFHNYPMVLQQALAGHGIALGWRSLVDELVAGDALVVVGPEVRSNRGYYVSWPAGEPDAGVQALVAWLLSRT